MTSPMLRKFGTLYDQLDDENDILIFQLKKIIWNYLITRYVESSERKFLEEATAVDPRFKNTIRREQVWARIQSKMTAEQNLFAQDLS